MKRTALDLYDDMPTAMRRYISNYGWHFTKEAFGHAVSLMRKRDASGRETAVAALTKDQVAAVLDRHKVTLENDTLYDGCYVYHMGLADYYGSSIPDERHLALFVKDTIDDVDASDGTVFRRWVATMCGNGEPIPWSDIV